MKPVHWLAIVYITSFSLVSISALAEPKGAKSPEPLNSGTHSSTDTAAAKLSSRSVLKRIANETGGVYVYKTNPSAKDYQEFLDNVFNKPFIKDGENR